MHKVKLMCACGKEISASEGVEKHEKGTICDVDNCGYMYQGWEELCPECFPSSGGKWRIV